MAEEAGSEGTGEAQASTAENLYGTGEGQTSEGQTSEGQTSEGQTSEGQTTATFDALEAREGGMSVAQEDFEGLKSLFEEAEVPFNQETAQKLVDFEQDRMQKMQQAQQEQHQKQISDWTEQAKNDRELGGEEFDQNLTAAQEALGQLATPELREVLEQTGLGSHPEMVRLFHKLAPLVREDGPGTPSGHKAEGEQSRLERLYGKAE